MSKKKTSTYRHLQFRAYLFLLALALAALPPGEAIDCDPVFHVVGRHYAPRRPCTRDEERATLRRSEFLQVRQHPRTKYMTRIGSGEEAADAELSAILIELSDADADNFETVDVKCTACTSVVKLVRYMFASNYTSADFVRVAEDLCIDLNVMHEHMCKGIVKVYGEVLGEVIRKSQHDPITFCSVLFNGVCYPNAGNNIKWNVQLPSKPKPPLKKPTETPGKPKLRVLHISDTHWDMDYAVNAPDECYGAMCCRKDSVPIPGKNDKSGKWGGWKCDIPELTFDAFIRQLQTQHKDVDYIIWTGDIPAHDIWEQDVDKNYRVLDRTVQKLKKAFPKTPIFPALGNHESIPPNLYPTKKQAPKDPLLWLYSKLNNEWHTWLPGNHSETIMRGGFYSVLVKPKLRIISMNMNYCYAMNWWLLVDGVDPEQELKWLVDELTSAESKGEKVHIIGHVPAGSDECIKGWQTNFYRILNRFENTVAAQFYGHTHTDEIEIFYDMTSKTRAFGIAYVAPSVTTYTYLNPGYRLYYIDGDYDGSTGHVLDHETWVMDLDKSNAEDRAVWRKLYSAKSAYNMSALFPENWDKFYQTLKRDNKTLELYVRNYWKDSPKRPAFDASCRAKYLSGIRSVVQYGKPLL